MYVFHIKVHNTLSDYHIAYNHIQVFVRGKEDNSITDLATRVNPQISLQNYMLPKALVLGMSPH